ncbi:MAG: hypothetical protein ACC645_26900, partial [Pirellulales bacterium]
NQAGELAGVLFGAGQGTTTGSYCGRVGGFLAWLGPDVARPGAQQVAEQPRAVPATTVATRSPTDPTDDPPAVSLQPPEAIADLPAPPAAIDRPIGRAAVTELVEQAPPPRPTLQPAIGVTEPLAAVPGRRVDADRSPAEGQVVAESVSTGSASVVAEPLDQARNILAMIGGLAVLFVFSRLVVG